MLQRIKGYLGLAARGRYIKFGDEALLKVKKDDIIFLAYDASELTKKKVYQKEGNIHFQILEYYSKEELGEMVGKKEIAIILLTNHSLTQQIKKIISLKGE